MEPFFSSRSKKLQALVLNAMMLGFTGMVHAHSQDSEGENPLKLVITEKKAGNKQGSVNTAGIINQNHSMQVPGNEAGNYRGAQPPQGGRTGQGGFVN
ncbi:hypothetical protein [Nitrosospira sp. NpAV]|uniref:hypothetical protein n=1 Tax=Nitrosospira sp. NpAV TaxID=58133 RepID=UPI0005A10AA4|nr:hypothetical protein [Nitrosospira sp. NpAV]KIO48001.1 hypothetical protein SQ11_14185 [Nitrosospira sp. NpAV]